MVASPVAFRVHADLDRVTNTGSSRRHYFQHPVASVGTVVVSTVADGAGIDTVTDSVTNAQASGVRGVHSCRHERP